VLETLARSGPTTAGELSRRLVALPDALGEVLDGLQRLRFVGVETKSDGEKRYQWRGRGS